jgi:hypothetical protein
MLLLFEKKPREGVKWLVVIAPANIGVNILRRISPSGDGKTS